MIRTGRDQMTIEHRIKYLKDTDHLVVKWVHRFKHPGNGEYRYHRDCVPYMTSKLSQATLHDVNYFAPWIDGYELVPVTKKELFEAMLKGT